MVVAEREARVKMVRWDIVYYDDPARRIAAEVLAERYRFPIEERVVRERGKVNPDLIQLCGPQAFKQKWFSITHNLDLRALSCVTRGRLQDQEHLEDALNDKECSFSDPEKQWLRGSYEAAVARNLEKTAEEQRKDMKRNMVDLEIENAVDRVYAAQVYEASQHRTRSEKLLGVKDPLGDDEIRNYVGRVVNASSSGSQKLRVSARSELTSRN